MKFYSKGCKKWAIPEKIQTGVRGVEDMEFLVIYIEEKRVPHNFAEFSEMKACFLCNF